MADLLRGLGIGDDDDSAVGRAQQVMYQAWEARDPATRVRLAGKALAISPDCADAYVLLAEEAPNVGVAREMLEKGVAAGERALGAEFFEENVGHFWGLLETRPYMRARAALADILWDQGERDAALNHYRELLRLNPGDNQGVRQLLVNRLVEVDAVAEAQELLDRYDDDESAWMTYARALVAFRRAGDSASARRLRAAALKHNPHAPAYLLGTKKLPRELPGYHGFGDEAEAMLYAVDGAGPWRNTLGALEWLAAGA
jgi:tetratricopeptide (TPR) repeat protein